MALALFQRKKTAKQLEMTRPRTAAEWRENGVDYALDKGIDVAGVLLSILAAWLIIRLVARRIERWGESGGDRDRGARARDAARIRGPRRGVARRAHRSSRPARSGAGRCAPSGGASSGGAGRRGDPLTVRRGDP